MCKNIPRAALLAVPLLAATALGQNQDGLEWSTYLGGNDYDLSAYYNGGVVITENGDAIVVGSTRSTDFPTTSTGYDTSYNGRGPRGAGDGFLTRLSADGSRLLWSSYFGGSGDDRILDVVESPTGIVTVCGWTNSTDFPTTKGAFNTIYNGAGGGNYGDAFVARFVWTGRKLELVWSTYLGGKQDDVARTLAVHPSGVVVVAGWTISSNYFPMPGKPYQNQNGGKEDGFVAVLCANGCQLLASTFLGGAGLDRVVHMALDGAGNPVTVGYTESPTFPTTPNAFQPKLVGPDDGFVTRFDLQLGRVTYSTLFGGPRFWEGISYVAVMPTGSYAVSGITASPKFPVTAGAFDTTYNGDPYDGFVSVIDPSLSGTAQLRWSTFLGGAGEDTVNTIAVERSGLITASGSVRSTDFPTTMGAFQTTYPGGSSNTFVSRFDPTQTSPARQLVYSTFLGGSGTDFGYTVALDGIGNAVFTGATDSTDFPVTAGAYDTTYNGGSKDAFVTKLTLLPKGVKRFGWSTPACAWPIYQGTCSWPKSGNTEFAVRATGAPPKVPGAGVFGPSIVPNGVPFLNTMWFVNPPLVVVPAQADGLGVVRLGLPIPGGVPPGTQAALQWLFETTLKCPGTGPFGASAALGITIQ